MRSHLGFVVLAAGALVSCQVNVKPTHDTSEDHGQHDDDNGGVGADDATATASAAAPTARPTATEAPAPTPTLKVCTEMGCVNGLTLELVAGKAGFGKGKYEIEVTADGKKGRCELSIPLLACDKGATAKCTGDVKLSIGEAGCALDPKEQGISSIAIDGAPASVEITLKRAGKKIGATKLTPVYKALQPNGPDCPPTCKQAKESWNLP